MRGGPRLKILRRKFQRQRIYKFESHTILSDRIKSSNCSTQSSMWLITLSHISTLCMPPAPQSRSGHLGRQINGQGIPVLVFKSPLFYWVMALKRKSYDVGNSVTPERNCKVLPLNEKVKVTGVSDLLASLGHTGRRRVVLGHTLNTLWHMITENISQCFK